MTEHYTESFTRSLDNLHFRNPVSGSGGWLYLLVNDPSKYPYHKIVTCNRSDATLIHSYRWRIIQERVVTLLEPVSGSPQIVHAENVILRRPAYERVTHHNDDPTDLRRVNLSAPRIHTTEPNRITVKGSDAFIHLPTGEIATIDLEDLGRVQGYRWILVDKARENGTYVRSNLRDANGAKKHVHLQRLILDIPENATAIVKFRDGDRFNFRKANLDVRLTGSGTVATY